MSSSEATYKINYIPTTVIFFYGVFFCSLRQLSDEKSQKAVRQLAVFVA